MIKTYDIVIEPHQLLSNPNHQDIILLEIFFAAIKEANKLGLDGYKIINFELINLGQHKPRFHRQFVIEFEEVNPDSEKVVTPIESRLLT